MRTLRIDSELKKNKGKRQKTEKSIVSMEQEAGELGLLNPDLYELEERIESSRQDIQRLCKDNELWERIIHETAGGQIQLFNRRYNTPDKRNLQWDKAFVSFNEKYVLTPEEGEPAAEQIERIWNQRKTNLFKQIQDCFCRPEHRVVNETTCSKDVMIDACLFSPDFISDEMLVKLGIVEFEDMGDSRAAVLNRLRVKSSPEVIGKLKDLIKKLNTIQKGNNRIFRMPDGRVFYISENVQSASNGHGPKNKVQIFEAYGAHRKTRHEQQSYGGENWNIVHIQRLIEQSKVLLAEWNGDTEPKDKLDIEAKAKLLIEKCELLLSTSINEKKQKADAMLTKASSLEITRKDTGTTLKAPGIAIVRLQAAKEKLEERLEEIVSKGGFNSHDSYAFSLAIIKGEQTFNRFAEDFEAAAANGEEIDPRIFRTLPVLMFAPFNTAAQKILDLQEGLNNGDPDAKIKIHVISKFLKDIVFLLEEISERLVDRDNVDLVGLKRMVDRALAHFSELQVDPENIVQSYKEPFENMQRRIEGIQRGLSHYIDQQHNGDLSEAGLRAMLQRLKDYIDSIDPASVIRSLPA